MESDDEDESNGIQDFGYNILLGPNKNITDAKTCV